MSFLDPDDYFLIIYYPPKDFGNGNVTLSLEDLKQVRAAGPKTVLIQTDWDMLELQQGVYNWGWLDQMMSNAQQAGFKVLMQEYVTGPTWCPKEWYLQSATTQNEHNQLSIWNRDAQDYIGHHDTLLSKRYPDAHLMCSQGIVGESYLPFIMENPFCDLAAVKSRQEFEGGDEDWLKDSVINTMIERNWLLMTLNKEPEIWHSAHYTIGWDAKSCGGFEGNGARFIRDVLEAERISLPLAKINGIQYTYWFEGSDRQMYPDYWAAVREDRDKYGIDFFVEAGYCDGLPRHTPMLVAEGHKGFILAPFSPMHNNNRLEGWMLQNIRSSFDILDRRGK